MGSKKIKKAKISIKVHFFHPQIAKRFCLFCPTACWAPGPDQVGIYTHIYRGRYVYRHICIMHTCTHTWKHTSLKDKALSHRRPHSSYIT